MVRDIWYYTILKAICQVAFISIQNVFFKGIQKIEQQRKQHEVNQNETKGKALDRLVLAS